MAMAEAVTQGDFRDMFPEIEPYDTGRLQVSPLHNLYYEQCGKKDGNPVIYLHGGPGSGCTERDRRFFDPDVYRVILMDQRGAGKSTPAAEIKENTIWDLVSDMETLRQHLGVTSWVVFGGSWGSTLALVYAISHADVVKALVLRGIYLGTRQEEDWVYSDKGVANIYPEYFEKFISIIPKVERRSLIDAYYRRMTSDDHAECIKYAKAWNEWELIGTKLRPDLASLARSEEDEVWTVQHARMECHYFLHGCFLEEDWIVKNVAKLRGIPTTIVQGRYDMTCPPKAAWELHRRLPEAQLFFVPAAGHSTKEPEVLHRLLEATDKYKLL